MKRTFSRLGIGTLVASLALLTACNKPADVTDASTLPTDEASLIEAAKAEGTVSVGAGGHTEAQAQLLAEKFEAKYGIEVDFVRESGGDITQKLQAQLTAGNVTFDVISLNDTATLDEFSTQGVITDPMVANKADVLRPLATGDAPYLPFTWSALGYTYNDSKADAATLPKTWEEVAKAAGNKAVADPATSGAALTFAAVMNQVDPTFFDSLASGGKVLTSDSSLALGQTVLTGEADFGLPGIEHDVSTARAAGEPLAMGYPEGPIGALASYLTPLSAAAHPAAARLLVQYSLSAEFQEAQKEIGSRSVLTAIDTPADMDEVTEDRMLVVDKDTLAAEKDTLLANFDKAVGR